MNGQSILAALVSVWLLLYSIPSHPQLRNPATSTVAPAAHESAGTGGALVFRTEGHLATFLPGRACLAALDHALCVEFIDGARTIPQSPAAGLVDGPLPLGEVHYGELWPGINLVYTGAGGDAKATYQVAPGADPGSIRLRYNMPAALQADGSLRFEPASGRGVLTESAPVAWQEMGGRRVPVDVAFVVSGDSSVGFRLGAYDRRYPLIIDPTYAWHTFYGSGDWDGGHDVAVDAAGNVYIVGTTYDPWLGDGGAQPLHAHSGLNDDLFVLKLDSSGTYQWHTFYGSDYWDGGYGVVVDAAGNVCVTGYSEATWNGSGGEPPLNAHTGLDDVVVLKLDSNGAYQWHTFYGSSQTDTGQDIAVDGAGNIYVVGMTYETWLGDEGAQPLHTHSQGSNDDLIVFKLDPDGGYLWNTFYGSGDRDGGYGVAVDAAGDVYVTGFSAATWNGSGGEPPLHAHTGLDDALILKLDSSGAYQWHTFYGSGDWDGSSDVAVDTAGNVYVTGYSAATWDGSGGEPPLHAYTGWDDAMILKLDSNGCYLWHTFYGSGGAEDIDAGQDIVVDEASNLYVTGYSDATWNGSGGEPPLHEHTGWGNAVVLKLDSSGAYQWHTFYGDDGYGVALDVAGNVYIAGSSAATWQGDGGVEPLHPFSGSHDLMVLKLAGDVETSVDPSAGGTLVFTDTQGLTTTLQVPPGAVSFCTDLVYAPLFSPTETLDPGDEYAHHAFLLHAYLCESRWRVYLPIVGWPYLPLVMRGVTSSTPPAGPAASPVLAPGDPVFQEPVTMTIQYSDADVMGLDENTLRMVYWAGTTWEDMAGTCGTPPAYVRDLDNNVIRLEFCHMSQGALVGN